MINIVIPMAGEGSRFVKKGYKTPKPFVDVAGQPMITRVLDNLYYPGVNFILIARKEHMEQSQDIVRKIKKNIMQHLLPLINSRKGLPVRFFLHDR